jgi:hypothetical protein
MPAGTGEGVAGTAVVAAGGFAGSTVVRYLEYQTAGRWDGAKPAALLVVVEIERLQGPACRELLSPIAAEACEVAAQKCTVERHRKNLDSSVAAAAAEACEVPVQECAVVRRRKNLDSSIAAAAEACEAPVQ